MENNKSQAAMIWSIADILRGGWKQHEYQDVILPLVVLRRLDSILEDTKSKVLEQHNRYNGKIKDLEPILKKAAGVEFFNASPYTFKKLLEDPRQIVKNFKLYLNGYSSNIRDIFEKFDFDKQLSRLEGGQLLYLVITQLANIDLHPKSVDNYQMGNIFEELLRKFSEMSNETAGEHYTPRDVIKLMVEILLEPDQKELNRPHIIKKIYDPACGTGGMLTIAKDYIHEKINKNADVYLYGQELNSVTYAIAKSDMLIKGEDPDLIRGGEKDHQKASTLSNDQFFGDIFDYGLSNPPYGVDWKKDKEVVDREASRGYAGRFGAGTPRISDGQLLFLQHLISKMKPEKDGGSRIAIVHNGSPLFTGDAGSGESEIRRWILEKDYLEAIVALPDQLFYNTGINTYLWFITNRKSKERSGKVQLIDARSFGKKMRKSLGNKRHEINDEFRAKTLEIYKSFKEEEFSKIFKTTDFGYRQITIERPLQIKFEITPEKQKYLHSFFDLDPVDAEEWIKDAKRGVEELSKTALDQASKNILKNAETNQILAGGLRKTFNELAGKIWLDREQFISDLENISKKNMDGAKTGKSMLKTIISIVGERDENAKICKDENGNPEADSELRDYENVPLGQDIYKYFEKEVKPYVADAWIDKSVRDHKDNEVGKIGYEIPFTRYFYKYEAPRNLEAIETDIEKVENELLDLLKQL